MTVEEIFSEMVEIRERKTTEALREGDLAVEYHRMVGGSRNKALGSLAAATGTSEMAGLNVSYRVSEAFPEGDPARDWDLTHSHLRAVLPLAPHERHEWLQRATDNQWPATRLTREIRGDQGEIEKCECDRCHAIHRKAE